MDIVKEKKATRKKPGPIPTPGRVRTTIYMDEEITEWGKRQPSGLSELIRRLLIEEKTRQENA
jgi:hypothetical protein